MGPGVGVGVELVPGGLVVPGGWLVGGGGFLDGRGGTGGFCFGFWPGGLRIGIGKMFGPTEMVGPL